jgi:hypothetical protein
MTGKTNDKPIKEAFEEMLDTFHLQQKFRQQKIIVTWEQVMGKVVANRTTKLFFQNKKLFIYLSSSVLREELLNHKEDIIKKLNEEAGAEIVTEIVFS